MVQEGDVVARAEGVEAQDQQLPAQPSSPAGSNSSKEEKNAREKLKKTSIAGLKQHIIDGESTSTTDTLTPQDTNESTVQVTSNNGIRGRPAKKRSFEDLAKDDAAVDAADNSAQPPEPKSGHHKRMRSRDVATGDNVQSYNKMDGDKSETVHEETDMDAQTAPGGPGVLVDAPSQEEMEQDEINQHTIQDVESNIPSALNPTSTEVSSTEPQSSSKVPASSAFTNTSTASPFGQTKPISSDPSAKDPAKVTSPSAFASSGLSAFASTDKSPFGAASSSKSPGGFGGGQSTGGFGSSRGGFGTSSGFGTANPSSFGGGSGFGSTKGFGSTFGASKPFGTSTAFGTGGPGSGGFGTGKPFSSAAEKEDDEEKDEEEDDDGASVAKDDAAQDPRFHEQEVDTGEQGEQIHFSSRARLWFFSKEGGWKERGTGTFKINIRVGRDSMSEDTEVDIEARAESNGRRKARLLMRADATHRVILNTPIFKGMQFGAADGSEPTGKIMHLQSLEDSKPVPLQLKIGKEETLKELYHHLRELEEEA